MCYYKHYLFSACGHDIISREPIPHSRAPPCPTQTDNGSDLFSVPSLTSRNDDHSESDTSQTCPSSPGPPPPIIIDEPSPWELEVSSSHAPPMRYPKRTHSTKEPFSRPQHDPRNQIADNPTFLTVPRYLRADSLRSDSASESAETDMYTDPDLDIDHEQDNNCSGSNGNNHHHDESKNDHHRCRPADSQQQLQQQQCILKLTHPLHTYRIAEFCLDCHRSRGMRLARFEAAGTVMQRVMSRDSSAARSRSRSKSGSKTGSRDSHGGIQKRGSDDTVVGGGGGGDGGGVREDGSSESSLANEGAGTGTKAGVRDGSGNVATGGHTNSDTESTKAEKKWSLASKVVKDFALSGWMMNSSSSAPTHNSSTSISDSNMNTNVDTDSNTKPKSNASKLPSSFFISPPAAQDKTTLQPRIVSWTGSDETFVSAMNPDVEVDAVSEGGVHSHFASCANSDDGKTAGGVGEGAGGYSLFTGFDGGFGGLRLKPRARDVSRPSNNGVESLRHLIS